jgi:hypothetical protein
MGFENPTKLLRNTGRRPEIPRIPWDLRLLELALSVRIGGGKKTFFRYKSNFELG